MGLKKKKRPIFSQLLSRLILPSRCLWPPPNPPLMTPSPPHRSSQSRSRGTLVSLKSEQIRARTRALGSSDCCVRCQEAAIIWLRHYHITMSKFLTKMPSKQGYCF